MSSAEKIRGQIREFKRQGTSEKVIRKYRGLVERFPDSRRREVAIAKSPTIIEIFGTEVGPGLNNRNKADEKTIDAMEILGRIIERFSDNESYPEESIKAFVYVPFEDMMNTLNSYLSLTKHMGEISTFIYVDSKNPEENTNGTMSSITYASIVDKSFDRMKKWEFGFQDPALAKIGMMQWSIASAASMVIRLNGNNVKEYTNGVEMLHPAWNGIVGTYIDRGLVPLGEGGCPQGMAIARAFELLDRELIPYVKENRTNPRLADSIIDINSRLSGLLSEGMTLPSEVIAHFIRRGLEGVEHILEMGKLH